MLLTGEGFVFEPMSREDLPAVLAIERASHPEPWSEGSFREELGRPLSRLVVARLGMSGPPGRVVGYVCWWLVADELQILNLAVDPLFRRRGAGRALIAEALRSGRAQSARRAVLEVREGNRAALGLYESVGFRLVGARHGYYSATNETALLMTLDMDVPRPAAAFRRWPADGDGDTRWLSAAKD